MRTIHIYLSSLAFFALLLSCEKKTTTPDDDLGIDKGSTYLDNEAENQLKDDTWYYFKVLSLWQDNIPPTKPADLYKITEDNYIRDNYTQYFRTADDVMDFLTAKTPYDAANKGPIDRYSFLDREGAVSGEIQDAVVTSYGMYVFFLQTQEAYEDGDNAYLYVRMVDVGSPADLAGIRRGDRILRINNKTDLDYNTQLAQNFKGVNEALSSSSMDIVWRVPTGQEHTETMNSTTYDFDPMLSDEVFTVDNKKVGYLAFSSFVSIANNFGVPTPMYHKFETIFNNFQAEGIKSLIVDLRYNGGGSVATAEYLINKIVPASAHGKQMYYYKLNTLLTRDWKWTQADSAFAPVSIEKLGALDLDRVYFLVSRNTASASELLINSLRPYMTVQLIGPEKTYGKPVGFFPVEIGSHDEAEVYVTSFQMFNAQGYGDYFGGLDLNKQAYEDYFKQFGDPEEALLFHALHHQENGRYATAASNKNASLNGGNALRADRVKNVEIIGPQRAGDHGMFKFKKRNDK